MTASHVFTKLRELVLQVATDTPASATALRGRVIEATLGTEWEFVFRAINPAQVMYAAMDAGLVESSGAAFGFPVSLWSRPITSAAPAQEQA